MTRGPYVARKRSKSGPQTAIEIEYNIFYRK